MLHHNVLPKPYRRRGVITQPESSQGTFHADTSPEKIRIWGTFTNRKEPVQFDRVFKVGDEVEYGSYNLIYTGRIQKIGLTTITVRKYPDHPRDLSVIQMHLYGFIERNFDFDKAKIDKHNAKEMMCI